MRRYCRLDFGSGYRPHRHGNEYEILSFVRDNDKTYAVLRDLVSNEVVTESIVYLVCIDEPSNLVEKRNSRIDNTLGY